jgi:Recombinase zinc beta ribbon domain
LAKVLIHETIIPYDLFCALGQMKKVRSHTHTRVNRVFTLKGLLTCAMCGSALTPFWVPKKNGKKIFYYRCVSTQQYKSRCPLGYSNADWIEQLVEEKLTEMVNRQGFLAEFIASINVETEEHLRPLEEERRGLNRKLRELHDQIETYIEVLGQKGSTILPLIEEKVTKLQAEEKLVTKRRDELVLQLESRPKAIDAQIILKQLKDFTQVMALATPEEKAQILQLVLKDVRVSRESLTLNIYDFSSLTISGEGLKNRTEWLPGPDSNQRPSG